MGVSKVIFRMMVIGCRYRVGPTIRNAPRPRSTRMKPWIPQTFRRQTLAKGGLPAAPPLRQRHGPPLEALEGLQPL